MELDGTVAKIRGAQLEGLRDPGSRVVKQREQEQVALSGPTVLVDGSKDRVDLLAGQESEQPLGRLFLWYSQDTLSCREEIQDRRLSENETDKRADGGEPDIA